ncbi:glucose-1-phosphate cytidylyltransferase [Tardiphaga sp. vice278]|uniref:glucose-1-phosphate cytidylyltransferase n=1 Tax=Tardiphaga sp. vice278 TaxID=2592815 RepID=UPI0011648119|nr:glucose-1-phosphate cytidylyltransferase [Tardiphaga sp. vice278]QDM17964.1 glucose-1-phosphate cytidylyltransferase [Tardiphaga sp. vice278]
MKAVILAGGRGTRLSEETDRVPKPMVEIGGKPILWHIMKIYSRYNITEFVICLGYKGYVIKEYFSNYFLHTSDVTMDLQARTLAVHNNFSEPWTVTLIDTGLDTMTGGRLKAVEPYLGGPFLMTYGDGVADVDIDKLLAFHKSHGKLATVTAITPPGRFGVLDVRDSQVHGFREKIVSDQHVINGGFFVLEPGALKYISGADTTWEQEPMRDLAADGQLMAYQHDGFWQPMDALRDKTMLEELLAAGKAPWKYW